MGASCKNWMPNLTASMVNSSACMTREETTMTSTKQGAALAAAALLAFSGPVLAQGANSAPGANLEKLQQFRSTGTPLEIEKIPQGGAWADSIKTGLSKSKLPSGFRISLYAMVPDARHMAVGTNAGVVFVGTRKTKVYAVTDRDRDRVADEVKTFAPSVKMEIPNGVCFTKDGFLYIVEQNRVLLYPAAEFFYEGPDVAAAIVVKQGELIPPDEASYNHTARVCRIGPDN